MTLTEALELADKYYTEEDPSVGRDREIIAEHDAIRASQAWRNIVDCNLETIGQYGAEATVECVCGMSIRFGMRVQRILDSANAVNSNPSNEPSEERQQQSTIETRMPSLDAYPLPAIKVEESPESDIEQARRTR